MCSPTRASLLTGRNHHEIGNGQIAELANDWDGYAGKIPRSSALVAEVLKDYGYSTGAWGKWHNTPAEDTTAAGPFEDWPTGLGFEYFYGFLAGEASQYEPHLVRNTTVVSPPKTPEEGYHLSEDLADDAINWLRNHKALQADRPFFMYWASGCLHGPHHIMKEWADRYAGKFDDGWDAYRERVFERAKEKGWIPPDCELTPRDERMKAWDDIPEDERPFQRRLMEVAAGFAEHCDVQVGRIVDELDRLGYGENTLFLYIWGDNGSSAEGQDGTIAELLAQNGIPTTPRMHIDALEQLGGLDVLGSPKTDNQYHSGWGWAGSTPYKGVKLLASHLGGTRNPLAIRWPTEGRARPGAAGSLPARQRRRPDHLRDRGHRAPAHRQRCAQDPIAGASFARTLTDRLRGGGQEDAVLRGHGQPGDLSRRLDGLGVRSAGAVAAGIAAGDPRLDTRQRPLGAVPPRRGLVPGPRSGRRDARQARADARIVRDRSREELGAPDRRWSVGADLPSGIAHHAAVPEWEFPGKYPHARVLRAGAGKQNNTVTIDAASPTTPTESSTHWARIRAASPATWTTASCATSTTCFIIQRTKIRARDRLPTGKVKIEIETSYVEPRPAGPLKIIMKVDGTVVAEGTVPISAPLMFTANDCLDIGIALGSPVSLDYYDKAPFKFNGTIEQVHVRYTAAK